MISGVKDEETTYKLLSESSASQVSDFLMRMDIDGRKNAVKWLKAEFEDR